MTLEDYIRGLADKDLQREINRRQKAKDDAYHKQRAEAERQKREAQERKDREFAERVGVTWDQYQAIADYVSDKIYDSL